MAAGISRSDLRGASAESQHALVDQVEAATRDGADGDRLADELFGVGDLLAREPGLRRTLTDQSLVGEAKAGLVRSLFEGRLGEAAIGVVAEGAQRRWAGPRDLGYALEHAGVVAIVAAAEREGRADALEDELFWFGRLVSDTPALRDALADPARSSADKRGLLHELLAARVTPGGLRLAEQALGGSHRTVSVALSAYQKIAAAQRQRLVALVRVARPLDEQEWQRLETALARQYSRPVHLNVLVDPGVIGGVRVEIGDDVIDGTIASRLDDARRRLVG